MTTVPSETAYFRFGIISPLLHDDPDRTLAARIEAQASQTWRRPDGRERVYAISTIEEWLYRYRNGGIAALETPDRKDRGTFPSMPDAVRDEATRLFRENPKVHTSTVYTHLKKVGTIRDERPSRSTFYRWAAANRPTGEAGPGRERRGFEAARSGALWQADIMYGPKIPCPQANGRTCKTRTYLVAVIDDYSRLICDGSFFFTQGMEAWFETLRSACCRRGIPEKLYCDNGKVFTSPQIRRIGAVLGMRVLHAPVRDGAAKGKIERFFRTVRSKFLESLILEGMPTTLSVLNRAFRSWLDTTYNGAIHSAHGSTPYQRWIEGAHSLRTLDLDEAEELFLFETERTVKKDGTLSLEGKRFEIGSALAGKRVLVRYDPINLTRVDVWFEGTFRGRAIPFDPQANDGRVREGGTAS